LAADPDRGLFDAVDVMVPSLGTLHETVGVAAMAGGRHVLLEKPIAVSPASADRLVAAGAALPAGQVLMVAENSQYWPEVVEALGLIESGAIGEVCTARAKYWESASPALNESTPGARPFL
jgi:predicted dehydrogenase